MLIGDTFTEKVFLLERSLKDRLTYLQNFKGLKLEVTIKIISTSRKEIKNGLQ